MEIHPPDPLPLLREGGIYVRVDKATRVSERGEAPLSFSSLSL